MSTYQFQEHSMKVDILHVDNQWQAIRAYDKTVVCCGKDKDVVRSVAIISGHIVPKD